MKQSLHIFRLNLVAWILLTAAIGGYAQTKVADPDTLSGRYVTVGNHKLFITGKGPQQAKFTVIFESGAGGSSADWGKVIAMLPASIRVIAYDRAGYGKSEVGPLPRTMAQEVFELHELVKATKIKGQIILVGQSLGGLLVRLYTERYGQQVAGLVLVDPTHESSVLGSMKYGGWVRLREKAAGKPIPKPQLKSKISADYDSTADYMAEEFQNIYLSAQKEPRQLQNRPLVIIGAGIRKQPPGTPDAQWATLRAERDRQIQELTALSGNSKFILDPKSSHAVHYDNPEIVASAIQLVMDAVALQRKL